MVVDIEKLNPKKELGQHWLTDYTSLRAISDMAQIASTDTVLEVGPGLGSLTKVILESAAKVVAIEFDKELVQALRLRFKSETRLEIVHQDIREFDLSSLESGYKVVANIPYYLTNYLIRLLSQTLNPPSTAVLLIQQEVAQRLAAQPGQLSILGVIAQSYWEVELGHVILPKMFTPPPKINSQVVKLTRRKRALIPDIPDKEYFQLVKLGFSQKRKTLINSLSAGLHISKPQARQFILQANIDEGVRAQELSLEQWNLLSLTIHKAG